MLQVAIRESIYDIKNMFGRYKVILWSLILLIIVIINSNKINGNNYYFINIYIYSYLLIRPKISKIHFILPIAQQYLKMYLFFKSFSIIILLMFAFAISYCIIILFGGCDLPQAVRYLICEDIPFLLCHIVFVAFMGTDSKNSSSIALKMRNFSYVIYWICFILPIFHGLGVFKHVSSVWYMIITLLSYICAFYIVYFSAKIYKDSTIDFEKLRNPKKLWAK